MVGRHPQPMPEWGAELCRSLRKDGYTNADVAHVVGYSVETIRRALRHYRDHGTDRIPRQGIGKRSDVRWTFAGPHGEQNLAELERVKEAGDDAETLNEVWHEFRRTGAGFPAYRTLCEALQKHLDYTRKRVRVIAGCMAPRCAVSTRHGALPFALRLCASECTCCCYSLKPLTCPLFIRERVV